jgi:hypothetical protein
MPTQHSAPDSLDAKLDEIILHLKRIDRRDRMRMIGNFVHSLFSFAWIAIVIWSGWYFFQNSAEIMKSITNQAAASAAEYTKQQGSGLLDQLNKQYNFPNK